MKTKFWAYIIAYYLEGEVWDSCLIFVGVYNLKSLPYTLKLISPSLNVVSGFETDIRSIEREIPAAISGSHGFVSENLSFRYN